VSSYLYRQVREVIPYHLNKETFGNLLRRHQLLLIYPGFHCQQWNSGGQHINSELIMLASKYHVTTSDVRSSRPKLECPSQPPWLNKLEQGTLYVLLKKDVFSLLSGNKTEACREFDLGYVCTLDWKEDNKALLTTAP